MLILNKHSKKLNRNLNLNKQSTLRTAYYVCAYHCAQLSYNTANNTSDNLPFYPRRCLLEGGGWNKLYYKPHHNTTYVDAAYSYRPSSVVCGSVGLSVVCLILGVGFRGQAIRWRHSRFRGSKGCCHGNHLWLSIYGVHNGATWRIRLNRPCAAAMRPYVKLLWQLVVS